MRHAALAAALLATPLLLTGTPATSLAQDELALGPEARSALTLTIYNTNLALVSERRRVELPAGEQRLAILDVSRQLQPETVILSGDGLALVEQGFDVDLMTPRRLLERALGARVWVRRQAAQGETTYLEGRLISIADLPLVRIGERLEQVPHGDLVFEAEAGREGFRDRPTLFATLQSAEAGARELGIAYLTGGLTWQADYVARLNEAEDRLDLSALITLRNDSGVDFDEATLRLVAGQINQVGGPKVMARAATMEMAMADAPMAAAAPVAQQPLGDQHLYGLERPLSLADRQSKQVGLLAVAEVPVTKQYRFEALINGFGGAEEIGPVKAQVRLEFENDEASGLGRPLPAGVVRVYQAGPADMPGGTAPVFLGEDRIGHSAAGETLRLTTGRAFDVTGKSRRTAFDRISNKTYETGQEVTVENAKASAIEVKLVGQMPPGWRVVEESQAHEVESANRPVWTLAVPAGGEATLRYKVRVTRP